MNAALVLGRCRRRVLLFDDGKPRNAASHAVHGFLSRDGTDPAELRAIARKQLAAYPSVRCEAERVVDAARTSFGFEVVTSAGRHFSCRKLLLAGGVVDHLPQQPGFRELYGLGLFHCPYCDGWEQAGLIILLTQRSRRQHPWPLAELRRHIRRLLLPAVADLNACELAIRGGGVGGSSIGRLSTGCHGSSFEKGCASTRYGTPYERSCYF